jgi:isopentenyl diphosphate isomerase/L-lactate dehydrogenase-like FMN-dependent dehydrogenase
LLFPRILRDGHGVDIKTHLFGKECSAPIGFAPWAMNIIMNKNLGEKGPSKVAGKYSLPYILSTLSNTHPKEITKLNPTGLKMMQLYLCKDWNMNLQLIKIAEENKFDGLVITVDAQILGTRRK